MIDNNTFEDVYHPFRANAREGSGQTWWDNVNYEFGADHTTSVGTMWIEDNTINLNPGTTLSSCQGAGRYSFRYNNISLVGNMYPLIDLHGNAGLDCFGSEVYGNFIDPASTGDEIRLFDQRGGKTLIFYNEIDSIKGHIQVRSQTFAHKTTNLQPTNVSDSYYWRNTKLSGVLFSFIGQVTDGNPTEDVDFFDDNDSSGLIIDFDGTSGVGCGTLGSRPATCTTGVGYWATTQSCSSLAGMTGVNPTTPISGTLYKCTSTDTWTNFYTPLAYPHPLRTGSIDTLAPTAPPNVLVLSQ